MFSSDTYSFSLSTVIPRRICIENASSRNVCKDDTVMDHESHKMESKYKHAN